MRRVVGGLLFLVLFPWSGLYAQFETAEILGTVRDASGASVPGAKVTLINVDTAIQSATVTDEVGNYDFFSVKDGRYSITVESTGFSKASITDITANVNARQRVDVNLQLGAVADFVEVSGAVKLWKQ